jgi:hypothetical protein
MKLGDAYEGYYQHSGSVSALVEKLSFGGIAAVLVLSGGIGSSDLHVNFALKAALVFFAMGLVAHATQYIGQTQRWKNFADAKDKEVAERRLGPDADSNEQNVDQAPEDINRWGWGFFWCKIGLTAAGWLLVVCTFLTRVK